MRICVYGAGAIGGHIAGRLAKGGAEVSLVARGAQLAAIQANGLTVHAFDGTHHSRPRASANPAELGRQDAVIVTVKAPALPSVATGIAPLLGPDTPVAFVMNGIPWWYFDRQGGPHDGRRLAEIDPGDTLREAVGIGRTIGGVVYSACEVVSPGVIRSEHDRNRVILGEPDGSDSPRAEAIAAILRAGGIASPVVQDIRRELWLKLMGNLANGPLCILSRHGVADTFADPAVRAAATRHMQEAAAIAARLGIDVAGDIEPRVAHAAKLQHKPSILQDLELGRPMEIDALFTAPLNLARLTGTPTPALDLCVALAKQAARAAGLYAP